MNFPIALNNVESDADRPAADKGYVLMVVRAIDSISKANNQMLVLELDVAEGPCKGYFSNNLLRHYIPYGDEKGMSRLKKTLSVFAEDNPGIITELDMSGISFDQNRLVGLKTGGIIRENEKGYLEISYLTPIRKIASYKPKAKNSDGSLGSPVDGKTKTDNCPF